MDQSRDVRRRTPSVLNTPLRFIGGIRTFGQPGTITYFIALEVWLFLTVLFANFATALAEDRRSRKDRQSRSIHLENLVTRRYYVSVTERLSRLTTNEVRLMQTTGSTEEGQKNNAIPPCGPSVEKADGQGERLLTQIVSHQRDPKEWRARRESNPRPSA